MQEIGKLGVDTHLQGYSITFFLSTAAELDDLMSELQEVNDWTTMGLYLGIQFSKLEAIKVKCLTLGERRAEMLIEWHKNVVPTWSAVAQALLGMGMRHLASKLAQKHGWLNCHSYHNVLLRIGNEHHAGITQSMKA